MVGLVVRERRANEIKPTHSELVRCHDCPMLQTMHVELCTKWCGLRTEKLVRSNVKRPRLLGRKVTPMGGSGEAGGVARGEHILL